MAKRSKRYTELKSKIDADKVYPLTEALALLQESPTKFDGSVELHIRLGIDASKSDQIVRGVVNLPHGSGKTIRVIAFVGPAKEAEAKEAGADIIGTQEVIDEIKKTGKVNFDVAVATPNMMKSLGPIARTLGQKGLMPNPKTETIGPNIREMVESLKKGKVNFKNDSTANIHMGVGKVSFTSEQLQNNIIVALEAIRKVKPSTSKGKFIISAVICSSMSPGIRIVV